MQAREISIEDYSPDMSEMADQMYLGPQGQILELLDNFNQSYTNYNGQLHNYRDGREKLDPLEITKKFRWKPGTYAKIKKMYEHYVMRWQIRPRGVASLFNRRRDYYHRQMLQTLDSIERLMTQRRWNGAVWAEDSEQLVSDFNQFKDDLSMELSTLMCYFNDLPKNHENPDVQCYITLPETSDLHDELRDAVIVVEIYWDRLDLNVSNTDRKLLQTIPGWNTAIQLKCNMIKWFNQYHGSGRKWAQVNRSFGNNRPWSIRGRFSPPHDNLAHPYISQHRLHSWTNVCTGDLGNGIADAFMKCDWVSMYNLLTMWLTEFVAGYTGPLNQPNYMHIGMPKDWNADYIDAIGIRTSWCIDQVLQSSVEQLSFKKHGYCKEIECQMMKTCDGFKHEEERATNIIKAIPNITEIDEIETPFESQQVNHIFNRLSDMCLAKSNEELMLRYHTLTSNDWKYLIRNKCLGMITDHFGFEKDWWDMNVPANPDNDKEQVKLENEMITWAVSRNPDVNQNQPF